MKGMKIRLLSGFGKWIMAGGYCYCLVAGLVACTPDRGQVNVIPLPNDMEIKEGFFVATTSQVRFILSPTSRLV